MTLSYKIYNLCSLTYCFTGPPAWSEADNLALQDEEETDRLVVKYGEVDVRERMEFLGVH